MKPRFITAPATILYLALVWLATAANAQTSDGAKAGVAGGQTSDTSKPPAQRVVADQKAIIKVYTVVQATPAELVTILAALVPDIQVVLGPQPKFVRDTPTGETLGVDSGVPGSTPPPGTPPPPIINVSDQFVRVIILKGLPEDIQKALSILKEIDIQAPQVLIEAKIVEMSAGVSSQLGVTWNFSPNGPTAQFTEGAPARKGNVPSVVFGRLTRTPITFDATLAAAIQNNKARLLANPQLLVLYNHRSKIFIGDEVSYLVGTQVSQNGTTLQTGKVKVGVQLNVVASASPDGTINLKVNPEVGTLTLVNSLANGVALPQISRREVVTAVRLKDGETLVIGGLISETDLRTISKIPILGDLPLLGHLFRRSDVTKNKSELVIFLKATIVKD